MDEADIKSRFLCKRWDTPVFYSVLSRLAEPVGTIIAYIGLRFFLGRDSGVIPPQIMGILFGGMAGIMVFISLDELLPISRAYGKGHDSLGQNACHDAEFADYEVKPLKSKWKLS